MSPISAEAVYQTQPTGERLKPMHNHLCNMGQQKESGLRALERITQPAKFMRFLDWLAEQDPDTKMRKMDMAEDSPVSRNTVGDRGYAEAAAKLGILEFDGAFYTVDQNSRSLEALRTADCVLRTEGDIDDLPW